MALKKSTRTQKKQAGQFLTPEKLVQKILKKSDLILTTESKILEPSLGEGAWVFAIIDNLLNTYKETFTEQSEAQHLNNILKNNIYGVEYDQNMFNQFKLKFQNKYNISLDTTPHNFIKSDYFDYTPPTQFDLIIGNPPFGGTFNPDNEDALDKKFGTYKDMKIKKETYAFFTVSCLQQLTPTGRLIFILSDTFLTINTMKGLRTLISDTGKTSVNKIPHFSEETKYNMVYIDVQKSKQSKSIRIFNEKIPKKLINATPNQSWGITKKLASYFTGPKIGDYFQASSGMTIGNNKLFLRPLNQDNTFLETHNFSYKETLITLKEETQKARLNKLSPKKQEEIQTQETNKETKTTLHHETKTTPQPLTAPHPNYLYYNKSIQEPYYAHPQTVIYWENNGEAVYSYKKNGPWYLHGVGGKPFFKKEGITWSLISKNIKARYLPEGYILDSGSPIAVPRENTPQEEIYFIIGWLNTKEATNILKTVINHTRNIQSKDIERMPYPHWVSEEHKKEAIRIVKQIIKQKQNNQETSGETYKKLQKLYKKRS